MIGAAARLLASQGGHAGLRRHLHTLSLPREGLSKARRRPVIDAVVRAVRRDLTDATASRRCRRLVSPFNATDAALRHLWHADDDGSASGAGRVVGTHGGGGGSGDGGGAVGAAGWLAGMPLQLSNCTSAADARAPWQTWHLSTEQRTAKGSVCQGLCLAHRFSLQAVPGLCLSLGTTRTPRNPFQLHAQLAPCTAVSGATAEAMRARLHFNTKSGTIKTTHRVADYRKGLPEHRTTCGFWPQCASTRLLLPKPCWAALRTNFSACGDEEVSLVRSYLE